MWSAACWGAVAASSLLLGALLGVARRWPPRLVGLVLGFGAGALIASISFELAREGFRAAGPWPVAAGLVVGALTFFFAARGVDKISHRLPGGSAGLPLALGALLDGIPEQSSLGIGIGQGQGVGVALLVAIFVSNLPEAIGSATDMKDAGTTTRSIVTLWTVVALVCTLASVGGYAAARVTAGRFDGLTDGFAAGALLVMLITSMVPEASSRSRDWAGLAAVVGFAIAAGLSTLA